MGLGLRIRRGVVCGVAAVGLAAGAWAQGAVTLTVPAGPLLPEKFGDWVQSPGMTTAPYGAYPFSLSALNKAALEEGQPQRSAIGIYVRRGKGGPNSIEVEAIEFADRTGGYAGYTLAMQPGMKPFKELGTDAAAGSGAVLIESGATVALVHGMGGEDAASLKALVQALPKAVGNKGVAPLLPTLVLSDGLVKGSVRYALGPETYAAEGGVLPANMLAWDKEAEAVTAQYADKRGQETLTLLLYPTPEIAGAIAKGIEGALRSLGPGFAAAKVRREGELVIVASAGASGGGFTAEQAQRMVDTVHLKQQMAVDKAMGSTFHAQVQTTFSLLLNIAILSGIMMLAAILLALFLGGGRALVRVMRGKPAAAEAEFLSLHLAPQNKPAQFTRQDCGVWFGAERAVDGLRKKTGENGGKPEKTL